MADEKTFSFEILTLQKSFLREDVRFVVAPGREGVFEILPGHAPFVFALKPILGAGFEEHVDRVALAAFDVFMECRENLYTAKANEARRRYGALERTGRTS